MVERAVFGMPLYADDELGRGVPNGFDLTVRRYGLDRKRRCETVDPLTVQRIDDELSSPSEALQVTPACQRDVVGGVRVANFDRALGRAVVQSSGDFMDALMQAAAERNIQLLYASTDTKHRNAVRYRGANQRQGQLITLGIMQGTGLACRSIVVMRLDIGAASRNQKPVEVRDDDVDIDPIPNGWDENRQRTRRVADGNDILLSDPMRHVLALQPGAARQTDQRKAASGLKCRGHRLTFARCER